MILISVDLPAPLSPSTPTISFRPTRKSIPWSACTSPNVFEIPVSLNRSGASTASGSRWLIALRPAGGAPGRVTLSYFLFGKRREKVDVVLVGEPPACVDVQARESVDLRQANVQDGE